MVMGCFPLFLTGLLGKSEMMSGPLLGRVFGRALFLGFERGSGLESNFEFEFEFENGNFDSELGLR